MSAALLPAPMRGEVWLVNFDPSVGNEQRKVRPAVVISSDAIGRLPLYIAVPVTDWKTHYFDYPWFVELLPLPANGLTKQSGADAFQLKSLDRGRFLKRLGAITAEETEDVAAAVALCVGFKG